MSSMPPSPVVVLCTVAHVVPLLDVWIWYARPNAASQFSRTRETLWVEPRSTRSHCGSLNTLDQRVPVLPSNAAEAGRLAFSTEDASAGRPCDSSWLQPGGGGGGGGGGGAAPLV